MRFVLKASSDEEKKYISELNTMLQPRNAHPDPYLDVKWNTEDGAATVYVLDRPGGPGWAGARIALCVESDVYEIIATWASADALAKRQVRARVLRYSELSASIPARILELADGAISAIRKTDG